MTVSSDELFAPPTGEGTEVLLLGTAGGPVPMDGRKGIATAVVVDGRAYLVDFGHGTFDQIQAAGLTTDQFGPAFVTHLHSDHLADLYTLLWLRFGSTRGLTHPLDIYGPGPAGALPEATSGTDVPTINPADPTPGITGFVSGCIAATAYDLNIRLRDEGSRDIRDWVRTHELEVPDVGASPTGPMAPPMDPFPVMADDRVSVSAVLVQHPPVFPSFAFRFDTPHGSVVVSGDTTVTDNMVRLAQGADILVHEAIDLEIVEQFGNPTPEELQHHRDAHAEVTELGELAQRAGVGTLVLSHLVPGTTLIPDELWQAKASKGFDGRVVVGRDLMRIPVRTSPSRRSS